MYVFVSGAKLRIVNTAIAVGARIMSSRSEASAAFRSKLNTNLTLSAPRAFLYAMHAITDLGRYLQTAMCHWHPRQDGTIRPKEHPKAKVVT